jgi:protein SCO1/2
MSLTPPFASKRRAIKLIAGGAIAIGAVAVLGACTEAKPQFASIDITGADYARNFALPDHNGQARSINDFKGKAVVVFFGYTQCPDVCPTSMAELAEIRKMLGADGERLQGLFVTMDPERDTLPVLKAYMTNFDPSFLALRPSLEQVPQVARDFKIFYKKVDGKTAGSYTLDHSAGSYVFDTKGQVRLYSRYGSGAAPLAADIKLLLKGA